MENENQAEQAYHAAQEEVRMENENFLNVDEEDEEADVDAMLDSLFEDED